MAKTPSRNRPRRRRGRSRGSSLGTLLVALLVVAGLWFVGSDILHRAAPNAKLPSITVAPPASSRGGSGTHGRETAAANVKAVQRLGGKVDYGRIDPRTGQRSGIVATITPAMVQAAHNDQLGSEPDPSIHPPGWDQLPSRNRARGHLLGRQLGGTGENPANLVTLYQERANTPVMSGYETMVADAVRAGQTVHYQVTPLYASPTDSGPPRAIRIRAQGDHGFRLDVEIANTPEAPVTVYVAPTQTP
jgi:hypothetical protein